MDNVKEQKYKVVLDTVNGAGGPVMVLLLKALGAFLLSRYY